MSAHCVNLCFVVVATALAASARSAVVGDVFGRMPHGPGFRNVRDFGAKGDGVTDDTEAFIRALDEGRGSVRAKSAANDETDSARSAYSCKRLTVQEDS